MSDESSVPDDTRPDSLHGRRFSLVPLTVEYHRFLYRLSVRDENTFRWRYHGAVPPFDAFERSLYAGVLCQFVISPTGNPEKLAGLVVAYNASLQSDYCFLAIIADRGAGAGIFEGLALFLRYLLDHWPLRKIYLEAPEYNVVQFASLVRAGLLKEEARFKEHQYFAGRYWDLVTYAIYREDLLRFGERFDALFLPDSGSLQSDDPICRS